VLRTNKLELWPKVKLLALIKPQIAFIKPKQALTKPSIGQNRAKRQFSWGEDSTT